MFENLPGENHRFLFAIGVLTVPTDSYRIKGTGCDGNLAQ